MKMMKFNPVLMLVILCGGLQLSCCENLVCQFGNGYYLLVGTLYQCKVTALDNSFNNMIIDGYTGTHNVHKNDKDVKSIWINGGNTKYIPDGLGSMFNLLGLAIWTSQLVEIRSNDFLGMQNLEYLSLYDNKLTSVLSDAFSSVTKLKVIDLSYNQIKYIGSIAFDQLADLKRVDLSGNFCANKYYDGATAITQMKEDLKVNCVEPLSTTTTTTTTTTTQNPMKVELEALKNELAAAKKLQQKNEIEMNNLRDELQNTQLEITKTQNINCEFRLVTFGSIGAIYSCAVRSLNNENNRIIINGVTGRHENNKNVTDVKGISIYGNNIRYIPSNLGQLFNLTSFEMEGTNLRELKFMDFDGMQNLIYLNLGFNELTVIPSDGLRKLIQLKIINLNTNQLTELTNGIFDNNLNLERIYMEENKLKFIDADTFEGLTKLREVSLINNTCIDEHYQSARDVKRRLRNDLISGCFNRD